MQKTNVLGLKIVRLFQKIWLFWEKQNCAPFCALFGHDWCAFKFRIIEHSGQKQKTYFHFYIVFSDEMF